ncbi:hypothetical protein GALMADRAFT_224006 [Galerina marginata CBS 339.88]|uniref:Uncharacterized protein n=1 Tax=Galerina marginata (strain CBS 339.88) TaxID=685588 RepID=A0A067TIE2_GALM3|nr:hypothetical protein GALMADRAFT_224006 [Galerina marginata CBS 339.88]
MPLHWQRLVFYKGYSERRPSSPQESNSPQEEGPARISPEPDTGRNIPQPVYLHVGQCCDPNIPFRLFYKLTMTLYAFGFCWIYCREMAFDVDVLVTGYNQWNRNVPQIIRTWKMARRASAMFLPLSIALFQVGGISNNIYTRTTALSACLTASAGLFASHGYLLLTSNLGSRRVKNRWIEASQSLQPRESVDFWVFLALPVGCVAWSIFFCNATICMTMWTKPGDSPPINAPIDPSVITSAVFLSMLTAVQAIQLSRGMIFFGKK